MTKFITLSAAALLATASSAHAQLVGGIGGGLGGGVGGQIPAINLPQIPTTPPATGTIGSATSGHATGTLDAAVSKNVDTRSGKAGAAGSANGSASGILENTVSAPTRNLSTSLGGSANGGAEARLIGTDGVRGAVRDVRDSGARATQTAKGHAGAAAGAIRDKAGNLVGESGSLTGQATAALNGAASGGGSGGTAGLDLAGSATATARAAAGLVVTPGTKVFDSAGARIGNVRKVFTDARGRITGLLVKAGDASALLPAGNFSADGSLLVSAMSSAAIASEAKRQEAASGRNKQ